MTRTVSIRPGKVLAILGTFGLVVSGPLAARALARAVAPAESGLPVRLASDSAPPAALRLIGPSRLFELESTLWLRVFGRHLDPASLSFTVLLDGRDVTSLVRISERPRTPGRDAPDTGTSGSTAAGADSSDSHADPEVHDGQGERFAAGYRIDFEDLELDPDQVLRVIVRAATATGEVRDEVAVTVHPHVRVFLPDCFPAGRETDDLTLAVWFEELELRDHAIQVSIDGRPVTSRVGILGPTVGSNRIDAGDPERVSFQSVRYGLDLRELAPVAGSSLHVTVTAIAPQGTSEGRARSLAVPPDAECGDAAGLREF